MSCPEWKQGQSPGLLRASLCSRFPALEKSEASSFVAVAL